MNPETGSNNHTSNNDKLKQKLIEKTVEIVQEKGFNKLSLREVASLSNTSTQMIYTIFGGKRGLLDSLYQKGAHQLAERCKDVSEQQNTVEKLFKLTEVYREYALENYKIYMALFDPNMAPDSVIKRTEVFSIFSDTLKECTRDGHLKKQVDPEEATEALWSGAHGTITLELSGYFGNSATAQERYNQVIKAIWEGIGGTLPHEYSS